MATSIITTTTFTFATIIDVAAQVDTVSTVNASPDSDGIEITACMLNALPRCHWTARKHCGRDQACKS